MMKLKILGSAASEGWPAIFCECEHCAKARELGGKNLRARASYLVNDKMLVDIGPDTYYHDTRFGYFTKDLEAILITHTHADHFNANEFLNRCWGYMSKVTRPAVLAGSEAVFTVFEEMTKETLAEAVTRTWWNICQNMISKQATMAWSSYSIDGFFPEVLSVGGCNCVRPYVVRNDYYIHPGMGRCGIHSVGCRGDLQVDS